MKKENVTLSIYLFLHHFNYLYIIIHLQIKDRLFKSRIVKKFKVKI